MDGSLDFAAHHCTITPGGAQIEGSTSNLVLSANGDNRRWWYRGDTANWVREADFASVTSAIEFPDNLIAFLPYMLAVVIAPEYNTELRQDVIGGDTMGRLLFAKTYAPRGRNETESPVGIPWPNSPAPQQAQG